MQVVARNSDCLSQCNDIRRRKQCVFSCEEVEGSLLQGASRKLLLGDERAPLVRTFGK
jgi:hypothetical protein